MSDSDISSDGCEEEIDEYPLVCLFCDNKFSEKGVFSSNVLKLLDDHMLTVHNYDYAAQRIKLDEYDNIRLINYCRRSLIDGKSIESICTSDSTVFSGKDEYLRPVLDEDALISCLDDGFSSDDDDNEEGKDVKGSLEIVNKQLVQQVRKLQIQIKEMSNFIMEKDDSTTESKVGFKNEIDRVYFDSYSDKEIHEVMLKDVPRTEAYRDFMYKNKEIFEGKIVMDIGCGTGILSLFAATAGAKHVYAIDAAEIIHKAKEIAILNGLNDKITFIKGKMEEISLPNDIKVDIIVSEWMGYFLVFESMLPSVLYARDKYLNKNISSGVYPNKANMYICGINNTNNIIVDKDEFWRDVYGFNMMSMVNNNNDSKDDDSYFTLDIIKSSQIISNICPIQSFNILTMKNSDLDFTNNFNMVISKTHELQAFAVTFDTPFDHNTANPVVLSTNIDSEATHWKHSIFNLKKTLDVKEGDVVEGKLVAMRRKENEREYVVSLSYNKKDEEIFTQTYVITM